MLARSTTAAANRKWLEKMAREADRQRVRALRERLREARQRKRQAKADARATCQKARQGVREWVAHERAVLRAEIAKLREVTSTQCRLGRERVEQTHGLAVRQALGRLEGERENARLIRMAKGGHVSAKLPRAARRAEKKSEAEHEILAQLDTEQRIVWERVKGRIKGNAYASRLEVFQHWLGENAGEVARILTQHYERDIDRLVAEEERARAEMFDYRAATKRQLAARIERAARVAEGDADKRKPRPVRAPGVLSPPKKKPRGKVRPKKKAPGTALATTAGAKPARKRRAVRGQVGTAAKKPRGKVRPKKGALAPAATSRTPPKTAATAAIQSGDIVRVRGKKRAGQAWDVEAVVGERARVINQEGTRMVVPVSKLEKLAPEQALAGDARIASKARKRRAVRTQVGRAVKKPRGKVRVKKVSSTAIVLASSAAKKKAGGPKPVGKRTFPLATESRVKKARVGDYVAPTISLPGGGSVSLTSGTTLRIVAVDLRAKRAQVETPERKRYWVDGKWLTWVGQLPRMDDVAWNTRIKREREIKTARKRMPKKPASAMRARKRAAKGKIRPKLKEGSSREVVSANIRAERAAGVPQKQAVAIALSKAGLSNKRRSRAVGAGAGKRSSARKPSGKVRPKKPATPGTALVLAATASKKKATKKRAPAAKQAEPRAPRAPAFKPPPWPKSETGYVVRATALDGALVVDAYVDRVGAHTRNIQAGHSSPSWTFYPGAGRSEATLARLALDGINHSLADLKEHGRIKAIEKPTLTIKRGAQRPEPWVGRLPPSKVRMQARLEAHPVAMKPPVQKGTLRNLRKRARWEKREPLKRGPKTARVSESHGPDLEAELAKQTEWLRRMRELNAIAKRAGGGNRGMAEAMRRAGKNERGEINRSLSRAPAAERDRPFSEAAIDEVSTVIARLKERIKQAKGKAARSTRTSKGSGQSGKKSAGSRAPAVPATRAKRARKRVPVRRPLGHATRRPAGRVQFTGAARRASAEGRQFGELLKLRENAYDPGGGLAPKGSLVSFQRVVARVEGVGDVVQVLTDDGERLELPMSSLAVIRAQPAPAPF